MDIIKYVCIMNINFVLGILIVFTKYLFLKQLDNKKDLCCNWVNTFSMHKNTDNPGGSDGLSYTASELMSLRSLPRQWIKPEQQVLARLKGLGILNFRRTRSGAKRYTLHKRNTGQIGVNISNLTNDAIVLTILQRKLPV